MLFLCQVLRVFRQPDFGHHESLYSDLHFPWLLTEQELAAFTNLQNRGGQQASDAAPQLQQQQQQQVIN